MKYSLHLHIFMVGLALASASTFQTPQKPNNRPVIGVLAQECLGSYAKVCKSYIGSSYIKFVEAGGAQAVPVKLNQTDEYYEKLFSQLNGLLMPGGNVPVLTSLYSKAASKFYQMSIKAMGKGDSFPIFGTCLGFQNLMSQLAGRDILSHCEDEDNAHALNFAPGFRNSRMYGNLNKNVEQILSTENVTVNYHHFGVSVKDFRNSTLNSTVKMLSTNFAVTGIEYVSSFEAINYPIFGIQFHAEKNAFVWVKNKKRQAIPHSYHSILAAQHFTNFLVAQARQSHHKFESVKARQEALIYNYKPLKTVGILSTMDLIYTFDY